MYNEVYSEEYVMTSHMYMYMSHDVMIFSGLGLGGEPTIPQRQEPECGKMSHTAPVVVSCGHCNETLSSIEGVKLTG